LNYTYLYTKHYVDVHISSKQTQFKTQNLTIYAYPTSLEVTK